MVTERKNVAVTTVLLRTGGSYTRADRDHAEFRARILRDEIEEMLAQKLKRAWPAPGTVGPQKQLGGKVEDPI